MANFTTTQLVMLALLFVAGWLFGLASHPGGRKWKTRYVAERDAHAAVRRDSDKRVAEHNARITELERENARLAKATPMVAAPVIHNVDPVVTPRSYARPAYTSDGTQRGWFDWAPR